MKTENVPTSAPVDRLAGPLLVAMTAQKPTKPGFYLVQRNNRIGFPVLCRIDADMRKVLKRDGSFARRKILWFVTGTTMTELSRVDAKWSNEIVFSE